MKALEKDYQYCRDVIKHHSKTFYYGFKQLPEEDANAVYAVYTFCRAADDLVDQEGTVEFKAEQLDHLHQKLARFTEGQSINERGWLALRDVSQRYELDWNMFQMQLDGQKMDLEFKQPETLKDLRYYSLYVAGSVGRMLLPVLSDDLSFEMKKGAEELGIAMQITNILRDIGEDFSQHHRIYLPSQIMDQFGYTAEQLAAQTTDESFIALWEYMARYAEGLYDQFYEMINFYKVEARLPLLMSAMIYREILNEVRNGGYDCLTKRHSVPLLSKHRIKRQAERYLK